MSRRTTQVHSELKGASGTPGYMAPEMLRREVYDTERWNYVSPDAYQAEVVWLLQWEEEKRGPRTRVEAVAEKASSACAVS